MNKKLSAEYIAGRLKRPITKQAFTKKERNGRFDHSLVLEVADLLGIDIDELDPQGVHDIPKNENIEKISYINRIKEC